MTGAVDGPALPVLGRLDSRTDLLAITTVYLALPDDLAERGTWIDPVYV